MTLEFGIWDHFERQSGVPVGLQYAERIELIVAAENYGFARYHIAEHHLTPLDMGPSPTVFLSAVAQRTSRIRLGSMVFCLPLYHPVRLIQEICMLDHLSGGRFDPGVGRGVRDVEHEWFGLDPLESRERFGETLDVVLGGLLHGKLDYRGKFFQYADVPLSWEPAQQPTPPFWYAGNLKSAAELGMSVVGRASPREAFDEYWRIWHEGRSAGKPLHQGDPSQVRVGSTRHLLVAETDEEALHLARRAWRAYGEHFFATEVRQLGREMDRDSLAAGGSADRAIASGALLVGSPSTVRDALAAYLDTAGPKHNYLVAAVQWGDLTHAEAMRSLHLYATHVVPALAEGRVAART